MSYTESLTQHYREVRARLRGGANKPTVPVVRIRPAVAETPRTAPTVHPRKKEPKPVQPEEGTALPHYLTMRELIRITADAAACRTEEITGARRSRILVPWRHAAMYLAVVMRPDLSYPSIAKAFGRDHSVIMYAHDKVAKNLQTYALHIDAILDRMQFDA